MVSRGLISSGVSIKIITTGWKFGGKRGFEIPLPKPVDHSEHKASKKNKVSLSLLARALLPL